MTRRLPAFLALALLTPLAGTTVSGAGPENPALRSDPVALETALECPQGFRHADRPVVLLVHGTATTAEESWPSGFGKALPQAGFDWCTVQLPGRALVDIQESSEYVVAAVRQIHTLTGRRVNLVGHSQGAIEIRSAVRWWPEVRAVVDDLVSISGANRAIPWTELAFCQVDGCPPAIWQFSAGAEFMTALNRTPVVDGVSYTSVYSLNDELIQPSLPAESAVATIDGASNIPIQDVCPGRSVGHVQAIYDAAFFAVALDAFTHEGPADPSRIDPSVCSAYVPPGVDPADATTRTYALYANAFRAIPFAARTKSEPPLRDYTAN
jgi:pimeloyl-ACP methyl ester carboxylesterase